MDSSQVPTEYRDFADVFSKQQAKQLPPHRSHDLTILIKDETTPPLGPIYSLSPMELLTLWEFIEENVKSGLIQLSKSPCRAPVLFVKKKRWVPLPLCRLLWTEQDHLEGPLPDPPSIRPPGHP